MSAPTIGYTRSRSRQLSDELGGRACRSTRDTFRGIYVIVVTPFTAALDLDEAALRATLRVAMVDALERSRMEG